MTEDTNVIHLLDFGEDEPAAPQEDAVSASVSLRAKGHSVNLRKDNTLVVEWYDFGDDAPYESANMLLLDAAGQSALLAALGCGEHEASAQLAFIADRFSSYFEVREFLQSEHIPYRSEVDFQP